MGFVEPVSGEVGNQIEQGLGQVGGMALFAAPGEEDLFL